MIEPKAVFRPHGGRGVLSAVRLAIGSGFSLELQRMPASTLLLPVRRWHVLTLFLRADTPVAREGAAVHQGVFALDDIGIYPAGPGERIRWPDGVHALHLHIDPARLHSPGQPFRLRYVFRTTDPLLGDALRALLALARPDAESAARTDPILDVICGRLRETYAEPADTRAGRGIGCWSIEGLQAFIARSLATPLSVTELADRCGLTRSHFTRLYHRLAGMPPHHYVLRVRVERAKYLLLDPAAAPSEVAYRCGFADQSHLTRAFSRYVGQPPKAYQRWALEATRE